MKTAISLPDAVFEQADSLAAKLDVSRSKLYGMALEGFIKSHEGNDLTEKINSCIDKFGQPVDPVFLNSTVRDMRKVEW